MGVFQQLSLLLWRNFKLSLRSPLLTSIQLLWPLILFVVIAIIRIENLPESKETCYYEARALPSKGFLPFMQSLSCNLQMECSNTSMPSDQVPTYAGASIGPIYKELEPLINDETIIQNLEDLKDNIEPLTEFREAVNKELQNLTDIDYKVKDLFQDEDYVAEYLYQTAGLSMEVINATMEATVNLTQLFSLSGYVDFESIVCNESSLTSYLVFENSANVSEISKSLCSIDPSLASTIFKELQTQLDVRFIIDELAKVLSLLGDYPWKEILDDITVVLKELENIDSISGFLESFPDLQKLIEFIPELRELYSLLENGIFEQALFEELIYNLDQVLGENKEWIQIKTVISQMVMVLDFVNKNVITETPEFDLGSLLGIENELLETLKLNSEQLITLVGLLSSNEDPSDLQTVLCNQTNLSVFDDVLESNIQLLQEYLCGSNLTDILEQLDIENLLEVVYELIGNQTRPTEYNWDEIFENLESLLESGDELQTALKNYTWLLDSLQNLDLSQWGLQFIEYFSIANSSLIDILPLLEDLIREQWVSIPLGDEAQKQAVLYHLFLDLVLDVSSFFTAGDTPGCPENWIYHDFTCYQPIQTEATFEDAALHCISLADAISEPRVLSPHPDMTDPVLKLFISYGVNYEVWIDQEEYGHSGCFSADLGKDSTEVKEKDCMQETPGFICQINEDHPLLQNYYENAMSKFSMQVMYLGEGFIEGILSSFLNPEKFQEYLMLSADEKEMVLCGDFVEYPSSVNVTAVKQVFCNVNFTALILEEQAVSMEIEQLIWKIITVWNTDASELSEEYLQLANWTTIFFKQDKLNEKIGKIIERPPLNWELLMDFTEDTNMTSWESILEKITSMLSDPAFTEEWSVFVYKTFLEQLQQEEMWMYLEPFLNQQYYWFLSQNKQLSLFEGLAEGQIRTNESEIAKYLEVTVGILEQPVGILQPILNTLSDPAKAEALLNNPEWTTSFCNEEQLRALFGFPPTADISFFSQLCTLNITLLEKQISEEFYIEEMTAEMMRVYQLMNGQNISQSENPFNIDNFLDAYKEYMNHQAFIQDAYMIFVDHYNLTALSLDSIETDELEGLLNQADPTQLVGYLAMATIPLIETLPGWSTYKPFINVILQYMIVYNQNFDILQDAMNGKLSINGTESRKFYEALIILMDPQQQNELIESSLAALSDPAKLLQIAQGFIDGYPWIVYVCTPEVRDVIFDFSDTTIFDHLCSINYTVLLVELAEELDLEDLVKTYEELTAVVNGTQVSISEPIDWENYYNNLNLLISNLEMFNVNFSMLFTDFNITLPILDQEWSLNDINLIIQQVMVSLYGPLLETSEYWPYIEPQMNLQLYYIKAFNTHFDILDGTSDANEMFQMYYTAWSNLAMQAPVIFTSIFKAPQDIDKIMMLMQTDWSSLDSSWLCDNEVRDALALPDSVVSDLHLICEANMTAISIIANEQFFIEEISNQYTKMEMLSSGMILPSGNFSSEPFDWNNYITEQFKLQENFVELSDETILLFTNSNFTAEIEALLSNFGNEINEFSFLMIEIDLLKVFGPLLEQNEFWPLFEPHFRITYIVVDTLTDSWKEMNSNSSMTDPNLNQFMMGIAIGVKELPEIIESLMNVLYDPIKLNILVNPENLMMIFCDPVYRQVFFQFPASVNTTFLDNYLCQVNYSELIDNDSTKLIMNEILKIQAVFNGEAINSSGMPFDWNGYADNLNYMLETILVSIPMLEKEFNSTLNINDMLAILTKVPMEFNTIDWWIDNLMYNMIVLDTTIPQDDEIWNAIKTNAYIQNIIYKFINNKLSDIIEHGLTLDGLFENSTATIEYIKQSVTLMPNLLEATLIISTNPNLLITLIESNNATAVICDPAKLQGLFQFPDTVNVTALSMFLCMDPDAMAADLFKNKDFANFQQQLNEGLAGIVEIDWLELGETIKEYYRLLEQLSNFTSSDLVLFPSLTLPWGLNTTVWEQEIYAILERLSLSSLANTDQYAELMIELEMMMGNMSWWNDILKFYQSVDALVVWLNTNLPQLNGTTILLPKVESFFSDLDQAKALLNYELYPDMFEALMSLTFNVDKLSLLVLMPDPLMTLCASNQFTEFFSLPPESSANLTAIEAFVCSLNETTLLKELSGQFQIEQVFNELISIAMMSEQASVNWPEVIGHFLELQEIITGLAANPPSLTVDMSWWNSTSLQMTQLFSKYVEMLSDTDSLAQNLLQQASLLNELNPLLEDLANWQDTKKILLTFNWLSVYFINKLEQLPGKNLTYYDIYPEKIADYMAKLDEIHPSLSSITLQVLISSDQLMGEMLSSDWMTALCSNQILLMDIFGDDLPEEVNITQVQMIICGIDPMVWQEEWYKELDIENLIFTLNNSDSLSLDWIELALNMGRLQEVITLLIIDPPMMQIPSPENLLDIEQLMQILAQLNTTLLNPTSLDIQRIIELLSNVESLVENTTMWETLRPWHDFFITLTDIINSQIEGLSGKNITFADLFNNSTILTNYFETVFEPEVVEALMYALLNTEKLIELGLTDPLGILCQDPAMLESLIDPSSVEVNLTSVQNLLCGFNESVITMELMDQFRIKELIEDLMNTADMDLEPVDWEAYLLNINKLISNIEEIIIKPPIFSGIKEEELQMVMEKFLGTLTEEYSQINFNYISDVLPTLLATNNSDIFSVLTTINVFLSAINNKIEGLQVDEDGSLNLADLFSDSEQVKEYLILQLGLSQELAEALLSSTIDLQEFGSLYLLAPFQTDINKVLCEDFDKYLTLPDSVNKTEVLQFLCNLNNSVLLADLMKDIDYANIITELAKYSLDNWNQYFDQDLSGKLSVNLEILINHFIKLFNTTNSVHFDDLELLMKEENWVFNLSMPSLTQLMSKVDQDFLIALGTILNDSDSLVSDLDFTILELFFKVVNLMVAMEKDILPVIQDGGELDLAHLLSNSSQFYQLLQSTLDIGPETAEALLNANINPEALVTLLLSSPDELMTLICDQSTLENVFNFDSSVNVTALVHLLCTVNLTVITNELYKELSLEDVVNTILYNGSAEPFNWTEGFLNLQYLVMQLMEGDMTNVTFAPWEKLMMAYSDFTIDLQELQQLLMAETDMSLADLALWTQVLEGLSPFLESMTWWDDFRFQLEIFNAISSWLLDNLDMLNQPDIFIQSLFSNTTQLEEILKTYLSLPEEMIEMLLNSTISPDMFLKLLELSQGDVEKMLCNSTSITSLLMLPEDTHSEADLLMLQEALCSANLTALITKLEGLVDSDSIIFMLIELNEQITSGTLDDFEWGQTLQNIVNITQLLTQFLTDDIYALLDQLDDWEDLLNSSNMKELLELIAKLSGNTTLPVMPEQIDVNTLILFSMQQIEAQLKEAGVWNMVYPYLALNQLFLESAINKLSFELDLNQLLNNDTYFWKYLEMSLSVSPENIEQSLLEDIFSIWELAMIQNENRWEEVFCNKTAFEVLFNLAPAYNKTAVQTTMCHLDTESFFNTAEKELGINILELQKWLYFIMYPEDMDLSLELDPFDWGAILDSQAQLTELISKLAELPYMQEILELVNITDMTEEDWMEMLLKIQQLEAEYNMEMLITTLQQLDPLLNNEGVWREIKGYFESIGILASWFNDQIQKLEGYNFNLTLLLQNKTDDNKLLSSLLSSELASLFFEAQIMYPSLTVLVDPMMFQEVVCDPTKFQEVFIFPEGTSEVELMLLQEQLCGLASNQTLLEMLTKEMAQIFDLNTLLDEIIKLTGNSSVGADAVNWESVINEINQAIEYLIAYLQNSFSLPTFDESFGDFMDMFNLEKLSSFNLTDLEDLSLSYGGICDMILPAIFSADANHSIEASLVQNHISLSLFNDALDFPVKIGNVLDSYENTTDMLEFSITALIVLPEMIPAATMLVFGDPIKLNYFVKLSSDVFINEDQEVQTSSCDEEALKMILGLPPTENITEVTTLMCGLVKLSSTAVFMDILETLELTKFMEKLSLMEAENSYLAEYVGFSCSNYIEEQMELNQKLTQLGSGDSIEKLVEAATKSIGMVTNLLEMLNKFDLEELLQLFENLQPLFSGDIQDLLSNLKLLEPYMDLLSTWLLDQQNINASLTLRELFTNLTMVEEYLMETYQWDYLMIDDVLDISITPEGVLQLHYADELSKALCDPEILSDIFIFPESINETALFMEFCSDMDQLEMTLNTLKNYTDPSKILELALMPLDDNDIGAMLDDLFTFLSNLDLDSKTMEDLLDLWKNLDGGSTGFLEILLFTDPEMLEQLEGLGQVLESLEPLLYNTSAYQSILNLLGALDTFSTIKELLAKLPDAKVSDLILDDADFKEFLMNTVGLPPQVVEDLMNANLNIGKIFDMNNTVVEDVVCSPEELSKLLLFSSDTNVTQVSIELCRIDKDLIANITTVLLGQLDVISLIDDLFIVTISEEFSNITSSLESSVELLMDNFNSIKDVLPNIITQLQNLSLSDILDEQIGEGILGGAAASTALNTVGELLCGPGSDSFNTGLQVSRRRRSATMTSTNSNSRVKRAAQEEEGFSDFCNNIFEQIQNSQDGAFIWAYVKPVLLGKIPYAPVNEITNSIISKSNSTFEEIANLKTFAQVWLDSSDALSSLLNTEEMDSFVELLENPFIAGLISSSTDLDLDSLLSTLDNSLALDSSELEEIDTLASLLLDFLSCIELDRFVGMDTEEDMVEMAEELNKENKLFSSIYFTNVDLELPSNVKYKIRMDIDNTPKTDRIKDVFWRPRRHDDLLEDQRYLRGFVYLQDMIDTGIMSVFTNDSASEPGVFFQQFPYPCHVEDQFVYYAGNLLPLFLTLSFVISIGAMTYTLVYDRERGMEEVMKSMGLRGGVNWWSWFIFNLIIMAITVALLAFILKVGQILMHSEWVILFLFLLCFAFSIINLCYLVSSFFSRANMAALSAILVFFITYLPYAVLIALEGDLNFWQTSLISLSSTTAFCYGSNLLSRYEEQGIGVQWSNVMSNPADGEDVSIYWMCIMMVIDGGIYLVLGWYIRNLNPGPYGIAKPWYFPLTYSYWCRCSFSSTSDRYRKNDGKLYDNDAYEATIDIENFARGIEKDPSGLEQVLSIDDLTKSYGSGKGRKLVVRNLCVNFYEGQVTALLGHNGAGKTTTISILTGMIPPTSGTAYVNNVDIRNGINHIRKDLGVCPQHNALYEDLTVREHLHLYGKIKGFSDGEIEERMYNILEDVCLVDKMHEKVEHLSGGMKRKLAVAIAFFGGTKVVILDEPTSGIDPSARRTIWDLILRNRRGRTILLATHQMAEADLLSDRIAILDQGRLCACGSSLFLKNRFSSGYRLTLSESQGLPKEREKVVGKSPLTIENIYTKIEGTEKGMIDTVSSHTSGVSSGSSNMDQNQVTEFIHEHVPGARLIQSLGHELCYSLPVEHGQLRAYQQFFKALDVEMSSLGISSYTISDTSLEEVFLNLSREIDEKQGIGLENWGMRKNNFDSENISYQNTQKSSLRHMGAMFTKRFHHAKRNLGGYFWSILVPALLIALAMAFAQIKETTDYPSLPLSTAMFDEPNHMFFGDESEGSQETRSFVDALIEPPGIGTACLPDSDMGTCSFHQVWFYPKATWEYTDEERLDFINTDYMAPTCSCVDGSQQCPAEGGGGAEPPIWKTNTSDILHDLTLKEDISSYLLETYDEFIESRYGGLSFVSNSDDNFNKVWFNNEGYHALPTFLNVMNNVILRSSLKKAGTNPSKYGITTYNHPLPVTKEQLGEETLREQAKVFGISIMIACAFSLIPASFVIFMVIEINNGIKHLQIVNGVKPWAYWLANILWDMFHFLFPVALCIVIMVAFDIPAYTDNQNLQAVIVLLLLYGWATISLMYIFVPLFKDTGTCFITMFCINLFLATITNIISLLPSDDANVLNAKKIVDKVFLIFPQYCLTNGLIQMNENQAEADIYARFGLDLYQDPFQMLKWHMVAMAIEGIIYFIVILIIEYCCTSNCSTPSSSDIIDEKEDDDVALERHNVQTNREQDYLVCLKNLSKIYSNGKNKNVAVNNICLGVRKGECFGLLGVNGAGKSTTLKMLTKALKPSSGKATINSESLGYCPQEEALDLKLTGAEHLYFYAKIKGFRGKNIKQVVDWCIETTHMKMFANKLVYQYSGGMKRKLSTAISLIGQPEIIFMDEPTTGMDPISRRIVWENVRNLVSRGKSVVFISHSMEECEKLCTRLAIMVNGKFRCIGTPTHIKTKFGNGYTLTLRMFGEDPDSHPIRQFMHKALPTATVKESQHNLIRFQVPEGACSLSKIFGTLESAKSSQSIQDYSVCQTTLDQVFINFAHKQTDGIEDEPHLSASSSYIEEDSGQQISDLDDGINEMDITTKM